jgi:hypothetical protein
VVGLRCFSGCCTRIEAGPVPPSSSSGLYCAVARQGQDARFPGVEEAPGGEVCWCLPGPSVRVSVCGPWLVLPLLVGSAPGPQVGGVYGPSGLGSGRVLCSVLGGRGGSRWPPAAGAPHAYPEVDPEPRACGALISQRCAVSSAYIWGTVLENKSG